MSVGHYENFPVASVLLPQHLRQPVAVIYRFARTADDFADEGDLPAPERLALLDGYRQELRRLEAGGAPKTPLFVDLGEVIRTRKLPFQPFYDLLDAFSQDVVKARYADFDQVLDYSQSRVMFGRPLAATQTIQIRLADMARRITTAQLLSLQLGRLKDAGTMSPSHVSLAKWNNCRMALDVARDARDILGGSGISAEYVPIRHALNLESVITYEGTETIHQLTIGRELTGISAF